MKLIHFKHLQPGQRDYALKSHPGTYAFILQNRSSAKVQVGRWREIDLQPGYYICVGSAFGPGGIRARVSRHLGSEKSRQL